MIRRTLAALVLTCAAAGFAQAQSQAQSLADTVLHHAPALRPRTCVTTVDLGACNAFDFRAADLAMGRVYRAAQTAQGGPELLTAQRTWLAFRDQECDWEGSAYGSGSLRGPATVACLTAVTRTRATQLKTAMQP